MSKVVEDTITQYLVEYLRNQGLNIDFKASICLPSGERREPDLVLRNSGTFYGEAEWENSVFRGFAQAHDYANALDASGSFVIVYPRRLAEDATQMRLDKVSPETVLLKHKFKVAFLRKDQPADIRTLSLNEVVNWFVNRIRDVELHPPDMSEILPLLKQGVDLITLELGEPSQLPKLFQNVMGGDPKEKQKKVAAKYAAGYLLLDQIIFYRILSAFKDFPNINPDYLTNPQQLNEYFSKVLEENYSPIFSFGVASQFSEKSIPTIRNIIKFVYTLSPEHLDREILGKLFHKLIPIEIRKPLGAYYTLVEAANLLANLSIERAEDRVLDPACGSGTLLAASYRRKKELLEGEKQFNSEDHKSFLERDLTGIDIMPFAAHLSVIHLALQAPIFETEEVRVAIEDSTKLKLGMEILPLSKIIPEAKKQRTLEFFVREDELVEGGSVKPNGLPGKPIRLDEVSIVIMNPPFTRQELITDFSPGYKNTLEERFYNHKDFINRKMSYCSYFILLADRFLNEEGKIAAVLPITVLRKETDIGIRKSLYDNYDLKYIVARGDALNFSDSTNLREFLLVAGKGKNSNNNEVMYVILKKLDSSLSSKIKYYENQLKEGEFFEDEDVKVYKVRQESLDLENMFRPISVFDTRIVELWDELTKNEKLELAEDTKIELHEGIRSRMGGIFPETALLDENTKGLIKRDMWMVEERRKENIKVRNRFTKDTMSIPIKPLIPSVRNSNSRNEMDLSNLNEFVISEKFEGYEQFLLSSGADESRLPTKWKNYLNSRICNVGIIETFHIDASGTYFFAYYTEVPRVFGSSFWNVVGLDEYEAKLVTFWLNSTLNFAQIFLERVPTGWFKIRGYVFDKLLLLSPRKLSEEDKTMIEHEFDNIRSESFPCIWKQLAMNIEPSDIDVEWKNKLSEVFKDFENWLGLGFEHRRKIDITVLKILGYDSKTIEETLAWLYPSLLKEIYYLKKMNRVDYYSS